MPYIKKDGREKFAHALNVIEQLFEHNGVTPGELNYLISRIAHSYVARKGLNYTRLNDVVGVFTAAKDEFYRRVVAPYEDKKISENGDI